MIERQILLALILACKLEGGRYLRACGPNRLEEHLELLGFVNKYGTHPTLRIFDHDQLNVSVVLHNPFKCLDGYAGELHVTTY